MSETGFSNPEIGLTDRYKILNFDKSLETDLVNQDRFLAEYIKRTDRLIGIIDGSIPWFDSQTKEKLPLIEGVIFLDKSARPISWLVRAFWSLLSNGSKIPHFDYLNIDREDWLAKFGREPNQYGDANIGKLDISKIPQEDIDRLRAYFSVDKGITENNLGEVWNSPTRIDGKHVLIVDEMSSSGNTLEIARLLLKRAVP